jgi:hypothetical protein
VDLHGKWPVVRYWLRNLFTGPGGGFDDDRWVVFSAILALVLVGILAFACRNLPA